METTACSRAMVGMKKNKKDFHEDDDGAELELGLGLSIGGGGGRVKFLTAQDLPAAVSHGSASTGPARGSGRPLGAISGTKRAADQDVSGSSPPALSQVVGWPPVRTYRINNLASQTKVTNAEEGKTNSECANKKMNNGIDNQAMPVQENTHLGFVKVNMDGVQIGRKVDLSAHSCYETLAQMIEDMFFRPSTSSTRGGKDQLRKPSKLLDGSSEFVLTYEDKEGDWMLVGDVPFGMFLGTVRRLRIMRTSEANGLAPRSEERNGGLRNKPI